MYGDFGNAGDRGGGGGGGGRGRRMVGSADFYRHVPRDMTEATKVGVTLSLLSILLMVTLFVCETYSFLTSSSLISSQIQVDDNGQSTIRLNFNITLLDLHCDFVSVDVWDSLGTNLQNITKDILKWNLDDNGNKLKFAGRNSNERPVTHEQHHNNDGSEMTVRDLHEMNGKVFVLDLDGEGFDRLIKSTAGGISAEEGGDNHGRPLAAFIDFYAPWCIWCQRLEPTWEKFAMELSYQHPGNPQQQTPPLIIGKVDCVQHAQLCKDQKVMAFPTLRWYENGEAKLPDYRGDRTVIDLNQYANRRIAALNDGNGLDSNSALKRDLLTDRGEIGDDDTVRQHHDPHHPGCLVAGHLMVNRVPGNFHIEARSINHEINPAMTNLSHVVHELTFGAEDVSSNHVYQMLSYFTNIPEKYKHVNPLKDTWFPTYNYHEAYHHHLKIVSTHMDYLFGRNTVLYQVLSQSQLVLYDTVNVPEIRFSLDTSPMSVNLSKEKELRWYQYLTSLLAIVGGTYTTLGLINAMLLNILKPKTL